MPIVSTGQFTITDANDAVSARLSNEFSGVPTNADGSGGNFTGCSTTITVNQGLQDITANGWSITALPSAGVSGTLVGQTYTVTGLSVDSGYVDLTATLAGGAALTKRFTVTKSKAGAPGPSGLNGLNFADAKLLFTDPTFQTANNNVGVYNNLVNSNVIITREAKQADSPFADSGFNVKISNVGTSSPGLGGFFQNINARASAIFVQRIVAKVPVGYTLTDASNAIGDGGTHEWLTSRAGTGKFQEYILLRRCGPTGSFSNSGHIYITGSANGTPAAPVNWYLAYATVYDFTALGATLTSAVLSNAAHTVPTDSAGNNGNFTGCATTLTVYNGATDDSANWTVAATPTNVTGSLTGKTYTVTGLSADVGYVDLVASRSGFSNLTSRFTITKAKAGATGATGAIGAAGANATFVKIVGCNYNAELAGFPGYGFTASNGTAIATKSIGHRLVVWNPATNDYYTPSVVYNTYASGTTSLVAALNAVPNGMIVCLLTQDGCTCDAALRTVLQSFGSSMSSIWAASRVTHVFIGMKGAGPGQAYEAISTAADASGIVTLQAYYTASGLVLNGAVGANGANGANATAYWLTSSVPAVQKSIEGTYTPSAVTYSIVSSTGTNAPTGYSGRFVIATSVDGVGYTDQYASAVDESFKAFTIPAGIKTVRVRAYLAGGTASLVDELITTVVSDGATGSPGAEGGAYSLQKKFYVANPIDPYLTVTNASTSSIGGATRVTHSAPGQLVFTGPGTQGHTIVISNVVCGVLAIRARFISGSGNFVGSVNVKQVVKTGQYTYQDFYTSATFSTPADINNWFTVFVDLTKQTSWLYNTPVKTIDIVLFNGANDIYDVEYLGFCGAQPASAGAPLGTYVGDTPAETVVSNANGALQKAGDAIIGPVTFATNGGILAATDADNGVFMGPNGLVGKKAGATTFAIDTAGNASFGGTLNANAINAVNTINIADNAVTVPVSAQWSGSRNIGATTVSLLTTPATDFGGQKVQIQAAWSGSNRGDAFLGAPTAYLEIYRNSMLLHTQDLGVMMKTRGNSSPFYEWSTQIVAIALDAPGAGAYVYEIKARISAYTINVTRASVLVMGVKK